MANLEILAPAGDMQSFKCAIFNGADAVYLGLSNFNARIKADNFTTDNIFEVVNFAHLYGVKVYLTINTLINDTEVNDFLDVVSVAIEAKVDAYIVQDFGMASLLKEVFPGIVLHASTQMGIHNLQGAMNLEKLGFSRVVLSRETKLEDIRLIHERTNLEIEYFVQGALCVAFSGNCYMSALKNGNSGNRGKCLQLCRLPYKVYNKDKIIGEGYFLSPKDLCLMNEIETLKDAGVTSLKIEGRLKRASYVTQVVRSYRKIVDHLDDRDVRLDIQKEQNKIKDIFSRGQFNEKAYLYDNFDIINPKISNHEGKKIGKVINIQPFKDIYKITLELTEKIGEGDAIRLVGDNKTTSIGVGNVNVLKNNFYEIFSTQNPEKYASVYLLKNEQKERILTDFERKIPISMELFAFVGQQARLIAKHNNITVEVYTEDIIQEAKNKPAMYEDIYKQLSKLGDTRFELQSLQCDIGKIFIAVSVLNDLRRRVVEELQNKIIQMYNLTMPNIKKNITNVTVPKITTDKEDFVMTDKVEDLSKYSGYSIIVCTANYTFEYISRMVNKLLENGVAKDKIYIDLPIVMTSTEQEKVEKILNRLGVGIVINNYSQLHLVSKYKAIAGIGMNVYNSFTAKVLLDLGVSNFVHSIEDVCNSNAGLVYTSGYPVLMTLCHCPMQVINGGNCSDCRYSQGLVLEDEKNNRYRLRRLKIDHCYFQLVSEERYERRGGNGKIIDLRTV